MKVRVTSKGGCYQTTFTGQEMPQYYKNGMVIDYDIEVSEENPLPRCFTPMPVGTEDGGSPSRKKALSQASRKLSVRQAVGKLNSDNDEHWTAKGLPTLSAVAELLGTDVTRDEIKAFAGDVERSRAG
jgi:hypothetical protein